MKRASIDGIELEYEITGASWAIPPAPFGLTPGTTYRFQVQAQDNCTGAVSQLSEPLVVTTPTA